MNITKIKQLSVLFSLVILSGCTTNGYKYSVPKSNLQESPQSTINEPPQSNSEQVVESSSLTYLETLKLDANKQQNNNDELSISSKQKLTVATEKLKLIDFIHQSFGLLGLNYVVDDKVNNINSNVTLNAQEQISKRAFYKLVKGLLKKQGADLTYNEGVYYVHLNQLTRGSSFVVGVGSSIAQVPNVDEKILQIVPLQFGVNINIERTINQLTSAKVGADLDNNTLFIEGMQAQILQALELVNMMDKPANRGKYIAFQTLTYIDADEFAANTVKLLNNEGIPTSLGQPSQTNVVLTPFKQVGGVAIFASTKAFVERVAFWAKTLDVPPQGVQNHYFIYRPKFARAADLGTSLKPLFGGGTTTVGNSNRDTKSAIGGQASTNSVKSDGLNMVVDERANVLVFETTGTKYQRIMPLIKQLDTLPRQVILEATIAEVTLTDEFKYGVEYNLASGNFGFSTEGGLGIADIAGAGISWAGSLNKVNMRAFQTNNLVNVLSNPTLLVRDGTSASITVGNEIPITTSVDQNDETNVVRTNVNRTQTGLTLNVTPTINTEGVVTMVIAQKISNAGTDNGNGQIILNREINTEVVANSGQTIIIGGLISENVSNGDSKVPLLGDIPFLGNLFKSKSDKKEKTELVILMTPKIITDERQWYEIKKNFQSGLENVTF